MKEIVYLKEFNSYNDILKKEHNNIPGFIKKIILFYKDKFNIITKKKINNYNIWVLSLNNEKCSKKRKEKVIKKLLKYNENIYVLSNNLIKDGFYKLLNKYKLKYINGSNLNKMLVIKILEYIFNINKNNLNNAELTIAVNKISDINIYLIKLLAKTVKNIKIVSLNIYKFKKLEEELYNEYGIAMQFSNSYKNSLAKSKIIINLDFNEMDLNEYEIYNNAIIINCIEENIKIKSKLFNGVIINSCEIKFKKEIKDIFRKIEIYNEYNNLLLYESILYYENNLIKIIETIKNDKVAISNLIGNNGTINKSELKKKA